MPVSEDTWRHALLMLTKRRGRCSGSLLNEVRRRAKRVVRDVGVIDSHGSARAPAMPSGASPIEWPAKNVKELLPVCSPLSTHEEGGCSASGIYVHKAHPWTGTTSGLWFRLPWIWPLRSCMSFLGGELFPTQTVTTGRRQDVELFRRTSSTIEDATASWTRV